MTETGQRQPMPEVIDDHADIVAGAPIPRETIRNVDRGYLVRCTSNRCQWEGLFPNPEMATEAANTHLYRERRGQTVGHVGSCGACVVDIDGDRARSCRDSHHVYIGSIGPTDPLSFEDVDFGPWYPRTTDAVDDLVERGDRIELSSGREGKVSEVRQTRAGGIATWSVVYAELGEDLTADDWQPKHQNELVARDGHVYRRWGEDFLGVPVFEVVGETDHQADFSEFGGGASA